MQIKANLWSNIRYLPLVEDVCSRTVPEDELSHLLDYLLDFACDEKCWDCTKGYVESI